jgi:hypothetical protein
MTGRLHTIQLRTGVLCAAALALAALAGCQSSSPGAGNPTASPQATASGSQEIATIGREYSQCVRDHGVPNYPDLVLAGGQLSLPNDGTGDAANQALRAHPAARDACQPILDRLPASAQKNPAVTEQDMENLRKFAQCMRQNVVPEWPDPRSNGSFPIVGTPLEQEGKSARMVTAQRACKQYWDRPISVK